VKAVPFQRGREPWRAKAQESHALASGLTRRVRVADSRVEQGPEGGGGFAGHPTCSSRTQRLRWVLGSGGLARGAAQRQEGIGVGDGARLHEREKLWRATTPRADPARNKAGRSTGRMKASGG
jgi:hypothetical protein